MNMYGIFTLIILLLVTTVRSEDRYYRFDVSYGTKNVDGAKERQVLMINNQWPLPSIRIQKGDRVLLNLTNHIDDPISIHFHGILQKGSNDMDGTTMLTQCGIGNGDSFLYNFTVDQVGTYWYHSHSSGQYGDGLRGMFLVDDPEPPFLYDQDVLLSVSDWYHMASTEQIKQDRFLRGSEPIVDSCLFNETVNGEWELTPNTTYYLRIVNMGMSLPQYLYLEDHTMTIVEIDGVYVDPVEVDSLYLTAGQRYGVLVTTKTDAKANYRFVQILQKMMSTITAENWLVYDKEFGLQSDLPVLGKKQLNYINDVDLRPLDKIPVYDKVDKQIYLQFAMEDTHYSFNHNPYSSPEIPTLFSVLSSPNDNLTMSPLSYGNMTNPYIIEEGEIVEIIVDSSHDMMRHPFHLHGHNFQVLYHGKNLDEMVIPEYPMIRDTMNLRGYSKIVLRFKADNPGVWIFHCHIDWHLIQGLGITLIESPELIRTGYQISEENSQICKKRDIKISGNGYGKLWETVEDTPTEVEEPAKHRLDWKIVLASLLLVILLTISILLYLRSRKIKAPLYSELQQQQQNKDIEMDNIPVSDTPSIKNDI